MKKWEFIITIVSAILGSSVLNGLFTHILYNSKLKKELRNTGNNMIAKIIEESLQYVRNMELQIKTQEILCIEEKLNQRGAQVNLFEGECIYPAIFNDWDSYNKFVDTIHECRSKYEKNLSCKIALNLVFIDRYINQLSLFMSEHGNEELLPYWGALFIFDLHKWQSRMDKMLVKEINKYTYKLESHETKKWKRKRKKELDGQYKSTILYYLLTGKCRRRDKKVMLHVDEVVQCILKNEEDK